LKERSLGDFPNPSFDEFSQEPLVDRSRVEMKSLVFCQPLLDVGVLLNAVAASMQAKVGGGPHQLDSLVMGISSEPEVE
jgi:hypothetical protein